MKQNLIPATYSWTDSKYEERGRPTRYSFDAREYKQDQLRSTMDTQQYELPARKQEPVQPPAASAKERKQRELTQFVYEQEAPPEVLTFRLTELRPSSTEFDIRKLFEQLHVIKVEVETDNITGACKGTAVVQVRANPRARELEVARSNVVRAGFGIQTHVQEVRKRSQYVDLSGRNFLDSMTEGQHAGEYVYSPSRETDPEWRREQEELHRWTQIRKTDQAVRPSSRLTAGSRLLQPTVASSERTRNR